MTPIEEFRAADALMHQDAYAEAAIYIQLRQQHEELVPLCDYRLAAVSNNTGDPLAAYELYYKAFSAQ